MKGEPNLNLTDLFTAVKGKQIMKTINTTKTSTNRAILLGVGLLGSSTLIGIATPASAQPRRDRDVKEARKDVKMARKDERRADSPEERRDAREDLRQERGDLREERRENRSENRPGYGYGRPSNGSFRPGYGYGRPSNGSYRPGFPVGGYQNGGNSYTGTVTRVRSDQSFDVSINGKTFNVYTVSRTPWGLSTGDTVRINGVQKYDNDIRDASVSVIRNR